MKKMPVLRAIFASVAALGALSGCAKPAPQTRGLTEGEAQLVQSFFGEHFETDNIRLHMHPYENGTTNMRVSNGSKTDIEVYAGHHSNDYSQDTREMAIFMHEVGHLRQHREVDGRDCEARQYTLTANARFGDFCTEQQSEMIEDYVDLYLNRARTTPLDQDTLSMQNFSLVIMGWLANIVEAEFPSAKDARLAENARMDEINACVALGVDANLREGRAPQLERTQNACIARHPRGGDPGGSA